MERYDGKSRKDDIRKYLLITCAVVAALIIWFILLHFYGKDDDVEPDYRVIFAGDQILDMDTEAYLEEYIADVTGDRNGDGIKSVDVISVSIDPEDYANASTAFMYLGELLSESDIYLVFLTDEPEDWPPFDGLSTNYCNQEGYFLKLPEAVADEVFPERARVDNSLLFEYLGYEDGPTVYAHICIRDDKAEEELALEIIEEIVLGSATVIQPR